VVLTALLASACASDKETAEAPAPTQSADAPAPGGFVFGGAIPGGSRFSAPPPGGTGAPDLNTVPTQTPAPRSSQAERDTALEGLIADRTNARYSDQGGRTMPVAVRPLADTPASATDAVARLDAPPPPRPPEAAGPPAAEATPVPPTDVVSSDIGPRAPGVVPRRGDETQVAGGPIGLGGFRPVSEFQAASFSRSTLAGTLTMIGGGLTPNDRNVLNRTARDQIESRGKGVVRIIGHGTGGLERAVQAAQELQRLGVSRNNMYLGAETNPGPTEVFFDRAK
jgi:hypothetical protein